MGIRVPPEPLPFGNDCLTCFPSGETPSILYVTFSGIKTGRPWIPALGPPCNGTFQLIQHVSDYCLWHYDGDRWHIEYDAVVGPAPPTQSRLLAFVIPILPSFLQIADGLCVSKFTSDLTDQDNLAYYGGSAWIWEL